MCVAHFIGPELVAIRRIFRSIAMLLISPILPVVDVPDSICVLVVSLLSVITLQLKTLVARNSVRGLEVALPPTQGSLALV